MGWRDAYPPERRSRRRVAKTKIGVTEDQQAARFQASGEFADAPLEIAELYQMITAWRRLAEPAMTKHRHSENRVVTRRRLSDRGPGDFERQAGVAADPRQSLPAFTNVAAVDVDALDPRDWEIAPQRKNLLSGEAAEGKNAPVRPVPQMVADELEQGRIAVLRGRGLGLKKIQGPFEIKKRPIAAPFVS